MLAALPKLMEIWQSWYPHLPSVEIEVSGTLSRQPEPQCNKTGAFFSGGIDSFFTVLHYAMHFERGNRSSNIDDLIFIWGFDIPADRISAAAVARESVRRATDEIGKTFVEVRTNLRQTRFSETDWTGLSHGCLLTAIALALEDRYQEILISSTYSLRNLRPLGSHPLTDPLFSTNKTKITHYGAGFSRVEKTKFLSSSDIAMRSLRVCFESLSGANCGACNKCYITLATLDAIGSIDRCTTLPKDQYTTERLSRIEIRNEAQAVYFEEIKTFAFQTNRQDIATAIDKCLKWNSYLKRSLSTLICRRGHSWLKKHPFIWRFSWPLRKIFKMVIRRNFVYRPDP